MKMPPQKPGRSKQDYGTPDDFFMACEDRFGPFSWDLAANKENSRCKDCFIGEEEDSLRSEWWRKAGNLWLNPPYADIAPWVYKAREESLDGARVFVLVPASIGSEWFRNFVLGEAYILALNPRLTFKGCSAPYPKDTMLLCYGTGYKGFDVWRWK